MDDPLDLERRGWEALSSDGARARRFYDEVLADEVLMLLPGGLALSDRGQVLDSMSGAPWEGFELADEVVIEVAADVAVVAYRATAQRGDQPEYQALCSSTYARAGDAWKLCVHQQTPV